MPEGIPIDRIVQMRRQGLSNTQIIQGLQNEGFSSAQIFDALTQADLQSGEPVVPAGPMNAPMMEQPAAMPDYPSYQSSSQMSEEHIAEVAEAIIDEKWSELVEHVNKIIEWKGVVESKVMSIDEQMRALKENFDRLHESVIGKLGEYDKGMKDVGTDIKALESVFKKILPGFVENVQELSRITSNIKNGKK